jgi:hypothetical protein
MAGPDIEKWRNLGTVSVWHYEGFPRNHNGYHLNADAEGGAFLLGLFERFRSACFPARKAIQLTGPTAEQLAVPACRGKCVPAERLELRYRRDAPEDHGWIEDRDGVLVIEMGLSRLAEFERGIRDIARGEGDWAIHGDSRSLWFW